MKKLTYDDLFDIIEDDSDADNNIQKYFDDEEFDLIKNKIKEIDYSNDIEEIKKLHSICRKVEVFYDLLDNYIRDTNNFNFLFTLASNLLWCMKWEGDYDSTPYIDKCIDDCKIIVRKILSLFPHKEEELEFLFYKFCFRHPYIYNKGEKSIISIIQQENLDFYNKMDLKHKEKEIAFFEKLRVNKLHCEKCNGKLKEIDIEQAFYIAPEILTKYNISPDKDIYYYKCEDCKAFHLQASKFGDVHFVLICPSCKTTLMRDLDEIEFHIKSCPFVNSTCMACGSRWMIDRDLNISEGIYLGEF